MDWMNKGPQIRQVTFTADGDTYVVDIVKNIFSKNGEVQKNLRLFRKHINEETLTKSLFRYINFMYMAHPQLFELNNFLKYSMGEYKKMRDEILWAQDINPDNKPINLMDYANYAFRNGTMQEKREITNVLKRQLYIHNETVTSLPLI